MNVPSPFPRKTTLPEIKSSFSIVIQVANERHWIIPTLYIEVDGAAKRPIPMPRQKQKSRRSTVVGKNDVEISVGIKITGYSCACSADSQSERCSLSLEPPVTTSEIREQLGIWSHTSQRVGTNGSRLNRKGVGLPVPIEVSGHEEIPGLRGGDRGRLVQDREATISSAECRAKVVPSLSRRNTMSAMPSLFTSATGPETGVPGWA